MYIPGKAQAHSDVAAEKSAKMTFEHMSQPQAANLRGQPGHSCKLTLRHVVMKP
jgi:hypothetical protein